MLRIFKLAKKFPSMKASFFFSGAEVALSSWVCNTRCYSGLLQILLSAGVKTLMSMGDFVALRGP